MLSVAFIYYYAECRVLFIVMLSVFTMELFTVVKIQCSSLSVSFVLVLIFTGKAEYTRVKSRQASSLAYKYCMMVEVTGSEKHFSLLQYGIK